MWDDDKFWFVRSNSAVVVGSGGGDGPLCSVFDLGDENGSRSIIHSSIGVKMNERANERTNGLAGPSASGSSSSENESRLLQIVG